MIDARGSTISKASVFYLWPLVLIGDSDPVAGENIRLEEEMFRKTLSQGIAVKVLREGIFAFDFSNWPAENPSNPKTSDFHADVVRVVKRVLVMNAYLACFYPTLYRLQQVTTHVMRVHSPTLLQFASLDDPSLERMAIGCPDAFVSAPRGNPDWRRTPRYVTVRIETIEESFRQFERVLDEQRTDMIALADLYLHSCVAFAEHDYSLALITAWAIVEKLLDLTWREYLVETRKRQTGNASLSFMPNTRLEKLTGRDFTASIISEVLSLSDRLPFLLYHEISEVRKARNNWVHGLKPTSRQTALAAIRLAAGMFTLVFNFDVQTQFVTGISV